MTELDSKSYHIKLYILPNYDFLNLSPPEFEDLCKDLLQKHLGITFETFTSGKDNGIDLRYAGTTKKDIIVQCKRYSDYNSFFAVLKKERIKVEALNPGQYIITTSVGLTPNQKEEILKLFPTYLKTTEDIYGKQELNNLLGLFPDIEKQHFKLWLSSANILERILHSRIYNQSVFEEDKIIETIKTYVENESYFEGLKILKDKKYVIISGIPGIGKTTLARILVYHFLANGFEEFIFLSDSIKEAYDTFKDGKKQVFLFDDFLGRNFLEQKLSNNEEQRIVKFIEKIHTSNDKILILTTREYILTQAKQRYDIFESPALEFAKCIIDLSQYTKIVRAKILYNHIFFSGITEEYINNVLEKKSYKWIIQHRNYSPRIIQTITNPDIWNHINPNDFSEKILEFLDYPESIWKHVYENQISKFSQCVLANLMSAGTPILFEDLKLAVQTFAKNHSHKYGIAYSELEFKRSIRELENTFIITNKDEINQIAIDYQNPSVQDFLVNYFKDLPDFIADILQSAIFFNQLLRVFAIEENYLVKQKLVKRTNKIILKNEVKDLLVTKLLNDYEFLNSSVISSIRYRSTMTSRWIKSNYSDYRKLDEISKEFLLEEHPEIRGFVSKVFGKIIIPNELNGEDFGYYLNLLDQLKDDYVFDKKLAIKKYFDSIYFLQQTQDFERFEYILPEDYEAFINDPDNFYDRINELAYEEAEGVEDDYLDDTLDEIKTVGSRFGMDCDDATSMIEEKIEKKKAMDEAAEYESYNWDKEDYRSENIVRIPDENEIIKNMFDSLRND